MRYKILLASALLGNASPDDTLIDGPPPEWTAKIAGRYGMDITTDGKVWINTDAHGYGADYSILANDLYKAKGQWRSVWIRGDHTKDKAVAYRKSMLRASFDCQNETYTVLTYITYRADGTIFSNTKSGLGYEMVIPGTFGEGWKNYVCSSAVTP